MWSEVRFQHGHSLSVAFGQVELFVCMTQSKQIGSSTVPLVKGTLGSASSLCEGLTQGFLSLMCPAALICKDL